MKSEFSFTSDAMYQEILCFETFSGGLKTF